MLAMGRFWVCEVPILVGVLAAETLGFLMPPSSVEVSGQRPAALKCSTAHFAALWVAAFLEVKRVCSEPKGVSKPSIEQVQENCVPSW